MARSIARIGGLITLAADGLLIALALAIRFAANRQWLVSGPCIVGALGWATSLSVRIWLLKSR
jgi:hypothetical protein